jgi:predicted nuclease with TOPRIM domain
MDDNGVKEVVIEGEIASEGEDQVMSSDIESGDAGADKATMLLSLEELIKNHIESSDKLKEEIKKTREMFDDSFNNNPTFREADERLKEVSKGRSSVKQQIVKQPSVAVLAQKVKDLRFDLSEQMKTLSDLLQDYHEQTGATQIEARNGQIMEIVSTARLVKKSKFNP